MPGFFPKMCIRDRFQSEYVGAYFDCGNILTYGWPEQWIRILGKRIAKIHIKEYLSLIHI